MRRWGHFEVYIGIGVDNSRSLFNFLKFSSSWVELDFFKQFNSTTFTKSDAWGELSAAEEVK